LPEFDLQAIINPVYAHCKKGANKTKRALLLTSHALARPFAYIFWVFIDAQADLPANFTQRSTHTRRVIALHRSYTTNIMLLSPNQEGRKLFFLSLVSREQLKWEQPIKKGVINTRKYQNE
jgi:hypothetical protein